MCVLIFFQFAAVGRSAVNRRVLVLSSFLINLAFCLSHSLYHCERMSGRTRAHTHTITYTHIHTTNTPTTEFTLHLHFFCLRLRLYEYLYVSGIEAIKIAKNFYTYACILICACMWFRVDRFGVSCCIQSVYGQSPSIPIEEKRFVYVRIYYTYMRKRNSQQCGWNTWVYTINIICL